MTKLRHEFVVHAPEELAQGVLYISFEFRTTLHLCACGCGRTVTMRLRPEDWRVTYDGETVSIYPSVGNYEFPCQSHYWIRNSRIDWIDDWARETTTEPSAFSATTNPTATSGNTREPWWRRCSAFVTGLFATRHQHHDDEATDGR